MRVWLLGFLLLMCGRVFAQAVLEPPLGMKWGDSPERLLDWAAERKLDVRITLPAKSPGLRIIRAESDETSLAGLAARSIEGRYLGGRLIELTLHYGGDRVPVDEVEAAFQETRRKLGAEHGKLTANQRNRTVDNQFATRTQSFHREPVQGLFLLLAYTEVEDLLRKTREASFSVLYRNDNLRQKIEAAGITGGERAGPKRK